MIHVGFLRSPYRKDHPLRFPSASYSCPILPREINLWYSPRPVHAAAAASPSLSRAPGPNRAADSERCAAATRAPPLGRITGAKARARPYPPPAGAWRRVDPWRPNPIPLARLHGRNRERKNRGSGARQSPDPTTFRDAQRNLGWVGLGPIRSRVEGKSPSAARARTLSSLGFLLLLFHITLPACTQPHTKRKEEGPSKKKERERKEGNAKMGNRADAASRERKKKGSGGLSVARGWALELDWLSSRGVLVGAWPPARVTPGWMHRDSGAVQFPVVCLVFCSFAWLPFCSPFYTVRRGTVCVSGLGLDWPEMPEVGSRLAGGEPVWSHAILGAVAVTVCGQLTASRHAWLLPKPIA